MATIYLGLPLPAGSSGQPGAGTGARDPLLGLAPDGVYLAPDVTTRAVSSYLAFSPLPVETGGMFLWRFPSGHPAPPLAGILPVGARTFLSSAAAVNAHPTPARRDRVCRDERFRAAPEQRSPSCLDHG